LVVLREVELGIHMSLQDETGAFHEIEPPEPDPDPASDQEHGDEQSTDDVEVLRAMVERLESELEAQKNLTKNMWQMSCQQIAEMDSALSRKDEEISQLRSELARVQQPSPGARSEVSEVSDLSTAGSGDFLPPPQRVRWAKAPPVDIFT